jgi:hypothetical protein
MKAFSKNGKVRTPFILTLYRVVYVKCLDFKGEPLFLLKVASTVVVKVVIQLISGKTKDKKSRIN